MNQNNGHEAPPAAGGGLDEPATAAEPNPIQGAVDRARTLIDEQVKLVLGVVYRGIIVSSPGVPPIEVLKSIARMSGNIIAAGIQADLTATLMLRREFKDAFAEGVQNAPIAPPPSGNVPANLRG